MDDHKEKYYQFAVNITESQHKEFKVHAAMCGVSMGYIVTELIKGYLEKINQEEVK